MDDSSAHSARPAFFRWLAENLARFAGTWIAVGTVVFAVVALGDGDGFDAPNSVDELLSVPFVFVAVVAIFAFATVIALLFVFPAVMLSLAAYLLALWWSARLVGPPWDRVLAVALSPVLSIFAVSGGIDSLSLSVVVASLAYGFVAELPRAKTRRNDRGLRLGQVPAR